MPEESRLRNVFAQNLRATREERGWTQEKMAERSGLHRTYVGSVERGERNVSVDNMERLAQALETTVEKLVKRSKS